MAFQVSPEKQEALAKRLEALGVRDEDLEERFILGSGKGGQKVNRTANCVYLRHVPSGTEVRCQRERSQAMNRFLARRMLAERLEEARDGEKSKRQQQREKVRRQKRRRSRRSKQKMVRDKRIQGEKKSLRGPVQPED